MCLDNLGQTYSADLLQGSKITTDISCYKLEREREREGKGGGGRGGEGGEAAQK